jgi:hypothetical protein
MFEDENLEEEISVPHIPTATDVASIIAELVGGDEEWVEGDRLDIESIAWQPHLHSTKLNAVLHVHMADEIRPYLQKRLRAARDMGIGIHFALEFESLYDPDTVRLLGELDASVHVIGNSDIRKGIHILAALADDSVPVAPDLRMSLATGVWDGIAKGTKHERGKRFEALLAFILGQMEDFRIRARNYRGDTDEIDIILQVERVSTRPWYESGVPFVLVEAKNWADAVGQKEISAFITKIQSKRGRCKIGFFFARSGYTSEAQMQELKLANTDIALVLLGPEEIVELIKSNAPEDLLDNQVTHAMLR